MKVIVEKFKRGRKPKYDYRKECKYCDTKFTYRREDVREDKYWGNHYLKCPNCKEILFIDKPKNTRKS